MPRTPIPAPITWSVVALCMVLMAAGGAHTYRTLWPAGVAPGPSPGPSDPSMGTVEQFAEVLVGEAASADAAYLSKVFAAAARGIEQDGKEDSPRLTTRKEIATLIDRLGHFSMFGKDYPGLAEIVGGLFTQHFPDDLGALTAVDRAKACELFEALSVGAKQ